MKDINLSNSAKDMDQKKNRDFWDSQAEKYEGHDVSWWDVNIKNLEVKHIIPYLNKEDEVIDIGCSNGASTLDICNAVGCRIDGFDYSEKSVKQAEVIKNEKLKFCHADLLDYVPEKSYDKAISIRTLINIMSWEKQKMGFLNIHKMLKIGGTYIMSEAFFEPLERLNVARSLFGLKPLEEPEYNLYLREDRFEEFIGAYFEIVKIERFSSLYYIGTRLFQYLAQDEDPKEKDTKCHRFFSEFDFETKNSGDYGVQKLYVLKKK
jgi:ubiquinone/menaquinone biosynthesis C-methylase UbiE